MKLIAESGSSKTDWRILDQEGNISQAKTSGLNLQIQQEEDINDLLKEELLPQLAGKNITEVYFYGAGCTAGKITEKMHGLLGKLFASAAIHVTDDLVAAARGLCGKNPGIACILGTGSNSCVYDGEKITDQIPPLGYILGDEGSGTYIGKQLLNAFLKRDMPQDLHAAFDKRFNITQAEVLENVYKKPAPNRYLASFSKFAFHHVKHPYIYQLLYKGFESFFEKNVVKYKNYQQHKIHFTGSIAFYYSNILRQVANDKGLLARNIMESPIAGLTLYHQEN